MCPRPWAIERERGGLSDAKTIARFPIIARSIRGCHPLLTDAPFRLSIVGFLAFSVGKNIVFDTASDANCVSSIVCYYLTICIAWITARTFTLHFIPFSFAFPFLLFYCSPTQRVTDSSIIYCIRSIQRGTERKGDPPRMGKCKKNEVTWREMGGRKEAHNNTVIITQPEITIILITNTNMIYFLDLLSTYFIRDVSCTLLWSI